MENDKAENAQQKISPPSVTLPKGGGAIRGIGEKFAANPVTGTGSMTVPIVTSPGRSGFGPQLALSYDSGFGNGPFGFGWSLSLPAITRKTDKGLPKYFDGGKDQPDSDVFILSGAEDLVPVLTKDVQGNWNLHDIPSADGNYLIRRYRPRVEGLFARIERWTNVQTGEIHWRSISRDNITTLYGKDNHSRIFDPAELDKDDPADLEKAHPTHIFSWLICQSYDDKGNAIVYEYVTENSDRILNDNHGNQIPLVHERNRTDASRSANRYLKRVKYGNRLPNRRLDDAGRWVAFDPVQHPGETWMFEVVFHYGEGARQDGGKDNEDDPFILVDLTTPEQDGKNWPVRQDPFSSYRAGFEVRTYRLCRSVFMIHHFPKELDIDDYLVRSTEFSYSPGPIASFITSVTQSGYLRQPIPNPDNQYLKKSLPPVEFEYSRVPGPEQFAQLEIRDVDLASLENLPVGLDGANYQWMDLDGEGTYGILTEQADAWFYKRNLSANHQVEENGKTRTVARFSPSEIVTNKPASGLAGGAQFLDLAGDGQVDLVQMEGSVRGFYERTQDSNWELFRAFTSWPNVNTHDPNLKFVDLTGDGHADILVSEDEVFLWYESLAEAGFGPAARVKQALDEENGPRLVFNDGTQSFYLADFSGDGMTDLARIRNGEICYWPNLGYGRFGAKVTMEDSPWFDSLDQFDQKHIRLADTDGSGTTDILYLRTDGAQIYFNQSGNSWAKAVALPQFPPVDNLSSVQVLDLLGNGTACLVWSSPLPGVAQQPMKYITLMEEKPHLLVRTRNNLGAETVVKYAPSTKFYLDDKEAGKPWTTRLPFPVHVVERVETHDYISRNRFVTLYRYHHGYFDGEEREFRGFGMVEQQDTEEFASLSTSADFPTGNNIDQSSHVPPALTKTWFHMGAYIEGIRISKQFEFEYYREGDVSRGESGLSDTQLGAMLLEDTVLPTTIRLSDGTRSPYSLLADEIREACRSLKGAILRQEVYSLDTNPDGTPTEESDRPYSVSERNYTIELLQPQGQNPHSVFFTHARETVDFHYERKLYDVGGEQRADPRVTHSLTLEVDSYGNVLQSVAIGYGRRYPDASLASVDQNKQRDTLATYTENLYTNPVLEAAAYRTPLPCESRTFEMLNPIYEERHSILPGLTNLLRFDDIVSTVEQSSAADHTLPYEDVNHTGAITDEPYRRIIEHVRTLYRRDDLTGLLPRAEVESLALPGESYKLALTPGLVSSTFKRQVAGQPVEVLLPDPTQVLVGQGASQGGYIEMDGDWWIPSGRIFYSPDTADDAAEELTFARDHFFLPHGYRDPFGSETIVTYDSDPNDATRNHNLLLVGTRDELGNTVTVNTEDDSRNAALRIDYRVLQPYWMTDPNRNRTRVSFDALGMVVATAVMGKPRQNVGDLLQNATGDHLPTDLTATETQAFATDPHGQKTTLLGRATTRIVYDLDRWMREERPPYAATLARETHFHDDGGAQSKIQVGFSYSDGFGREIQKKIQAEPGEVEVEDAAGNIAVVDTSPDLRWVGSGWTIFNNKGKPVRQYEPFFSINHQFQFGKKVGVSPVMFYDPVERVVATLHPNHTYEKVVFDPWHQTTFDVNDTSTFDPRTDPDVSGFFMRLREVDYLPTWYSLRTDAARTAELTARYPDPLAQANETIAATRTAAHVDTPGIAYFDTLGRPFLTIADNGTDADGNEQKYRTRVTLDIEGNQRDVRADRRDNQRNLVELVVMQYDYDLLGNRIHQKSMDAGERWMLNDVTGKPIRAWDSRGHEFTTTYDALRRPLTQIVRGTTSASDSRTFRRNVVVDKLEYGEPAPNASQVVQDTAQRLNLRTRVLRHFDAAGIVISAQLDSSGNPLEAYDFKGNLLHSMRRLISNYTDLPDWSPNVPFEDFESSTKYDALNRPMSITSPDKSRYRSTFNEANLLNTVDVYLRGASEVTHFVRNIDYNAKGQRTKIEYNEDSHPVVTMYAYDDETFRLLGLKTTRLARSNEPASRLFANTAVVQDLQYTYDPVGNITHIEDRAQSHVFFDNTCITATNNYRYDAMYRLIAASGREHRGAGLQTDWDDAPRMNQTHCQEMRHYVETYQYDELGNILQMIHHNGSNVDQPGIVIWNRHYQYHTNNNQLRCTSVPGERTWPEYSNSPVEQYGQRYGYDEHGNMIYMPHLKNTTLRNMTWDFKDQLLSVETADEGITYYVYDASGQRVRKVIHNQNDTKTEERIYLGSLEVYRKYNGAREGRLELIRETLHIMDDKQRIALVETRTDIADPEPLTRYQLGNHLGSALVELDKGTEVITYEEYHPYGSTSYHARRNQTDAWKRYRYTGKERDDESGLYYHGARYYAPWLGRWITCDPSGLLDGVGLYTYVNDNPIRLRDPSGQNSFEDLAQFIRNQAGFEQGARTPPTFQSSSGSPFGTAAHGTATGVVQEMQQLGFVNANRVVSEPVIVNDVIVSAGAGPAGAPKGSLAPDLLFTRPGTQGSGVGQQASVVAQELADIKYGGGQAAAKYSQVGVPVRTVNGLTSSAATQPSLAQMAAPQQPPAPSAPVPADAPAAPSVATESGAAEGAVSTMTTRLGAGAKIVKGLGVAGGIVGSLVGGVQVGTGLNQAIIEGKTGEGLVSLGEGSANLGLTIGAAALVKGKVITAAVGAGGAALTVAAGVAAAGAVALAGEDARRALRGEKSMAADAARYYSGLIKAGEREGGAAGKLKQAAGHVGDFLAFGFASLQGQSAFQIYKK